MNRSVRFSIMAAAMIVLLTLTTGCNKLKARDQLNKGVEAFKNAQYEVAIGHFQQAVQFDPTLATARLYLATAYAQQVVPNLSTPENLKNAQLAIQQYQHVLDKNPNDLNSLKGIAQLYFNTGKFDQARDLQKKVIAVDPNDPEAHYTVGVIDWTLAYKNAIPIRTSLGLQDDGTPIKDKKVCATLQAENQPLVQEGLDYLKKAVQLRPSYDDAMVYIQLLYRRKADIECGDEDARKADLVQVTEWTQRAMGTRKANEAKKNAQTPGGIIVDHK